MIQNLLTLLLRKWDSAPSDGLSVVVVAVVVVVVGPIPSHRMHSASSQWQLQYT